MDYYEGQRKKIVKWLQANQIDRSSLSWYVDGDVLHLFSRRIPVASFRFKTIGFLLGPNMSWSWFFEQSHNILDSRQIPHSLSPKSAPTGTHPPAVIDERIVWALHELKGIWFMYLVTSENAPVAVIILTRRYSGE